jgi:hypothetical protein
LKAAPRIEDTRLHCNFRGREFIVFSLEVNNRRRVALIRFHGETTGQDFVRLDRAAPIFTEAVEPLSSILDFSEAEVENVRADFIEQRGQRPPMVRGLRRIIVVRKPQLQKLARAYAASQAAGGWNAPEIVSGLGEALRLLDCRREDFHPVDLAFLDVPDEP